MTDTATPVSVSQFVNRLFPTLTQEQRGRIAILGRMHSILKGEVLADAEDSVVKRVASDVSKEANGYLVVDQMLHE